MTRAKRIFAYLLDTFLIWVALVLFMVFIIAPVMILIGDEFIGTLLLFLSILFFSLALVVLRDWIFAGRSLGKRIFGLYVYDKESGTPARRGQTVVRNLLFFISGIDGLVLLATGETLGDRMARAIVVDRQEAAALDAHVRDNPRTQEEIDTANAAIRTSNRRAVLILCAAALAFVLFCSVCAGLAFLMLHVQTGTEEYAVAREYLVNSEAFLESGAEEDDLRFTSMERSISDGEYTAEFGFSDGRRYYEVICHKEDGVWVVCRECTEFE